MSILKVAEQYEVLLKSAQHDKQYKPGGKWTDYTYSKTEHIEYQNKIKEYVDNYKKNLNQLRNYLIKLNNESVIQAVDELVKNIYCVNVMDMDSESNHKMNTRYLIDRVRICHPSILKWVTDQVNILDSIYASLYDQILKYLK